MGAVGAGVLENDDVLDFLGELQDEPIDQARRMLVEALMLPAGYLELPEASAALGAAAVVAARRGWSSDDARIAPVLATHDFVVTEELCQLARTAIDRVQADNSEWVDLWEEAGLLDEAGAGLAGVRSHL